MKKKIHFGNGNLLARLEAEAISGKRYKKTCSTRECNSCYNRCYKQNPFNSQKMTRLISDTEMRKTSQNR